jgi:hypothetical protein
MMHDRLVLMRDLLSDRGSIYVKIQGPPLFLRHNSEVLREDILANKYAVSAIPESCGVDGW